MENNLKKIEQYFLEKKGITVDEAFRNGFKYTAVD